MPIETICRGCSRKLRVGDEHAGKKARCPQCGTVYTVPDLAEEPLAETVGRAPASPSETAGWRLRTPDGRIYGPVPKPELDQWVREGRVTANCDLSPPGSQAWANADRTYPDLTPRSDQTHSPNPFADQAVDTTNPFSVTGTPTQSYERPHRGGLILTLAILGWAICVVFAPFAWSMGSSDIKAMRAGQMDPRGMGLTQAGMILGMVQTILLLVGIGIYLFVIIFMVAANV